MGHPGTSPFLVLEFQELLHFEVITLKHGIKTASVNFSHAGVRRGSGKQPGISWDTWVILAEEVGPISKCISSQRCVLFLVVMHLLLVARPKLVSVRHVEL